MASPKTLSSALFRTPFASLSDRPLHSRFRSRFPEWSGLLPLILWRLWTGVAKSRPCLLAQLLSRLPVSPRLAPLLSSSLTPALSSSCPPTDNPLFPRLPFPPSPLPAHPLPASSSLSSRLFLSPSSPPTRSLSVSTSLSSCLYLSLLPPLPISLLAANSLTVSLYLSLLLPLPLSLLVANSLTVTLLFSSLRLTCSLPVRNILCPLSYCQRAFFCFLNTLWGTLSESCATLPLAITAKRRQKDGKRTAKGRQKDGTVSGERAHCNMPATPLLPMCKIVVFLYNEEIFAIIFAGVISFS